MKAPQPEFINIVIAATRIGILFILIFRRTSLLRIGGLVSRILRQLVRSLPR